MATESNSVTSFTAGVVDRTAQARVDVRRLSLGAKQQTNWMSHVLGYMSLRPGLKYLGLVSGVIPTRGNASASLVLDADDGVGAVASSCAGTGAVNRVSAAQFATVEETGTVTFEEVALLTDNPLITRAMYGGAVGLPDVQAGPCFLNQSYQNIFDTDGPGYLKGTISSPLTVDTDGSPGSAYTVTDPAWTPSTTLAGDADFTLGLPFVIGFSTDVVGVGFTLGGFNTVSSVRVRAYDRNGNLLGTWTNTAPGGGSAFEDFYLNRDSNVAIIAGISIEIDPTESNGVVMKNVRFSMSCL